MKKSKSLAHLVAVEPIQAAFSSCPHCGATVLVRTWAHWDDRIGWRDTTVPLSPITGDMHSCTSEAEVPHEHV
jgi:hypothetical protein